MRIGEAVGGVVDAILSCQQLQSEETASIVSATRSPGWEERKQGEMAGAGKVGVERQHASNHAIHVAHLGKVRLLTEGTGSLTHFRQQQRSRTQDAGLGAQGSGRRTQSLSRLGLSGLD